MNIENNKELLLKPCIQRIEELYQDNKMLVEKYKEFFTNYYMSNKIAAQFKKDIIELEDENIKLKNEIKELKKINTDGPKLLNFDKYKEVKNKANTNNDVINEIDSLEIIEKEKDLNIKDNEEYKELQNKFKELKEDYISIQNKIDNIENNEKFLNLKSDYNDLLFEKDNNKDEIENYKNTIQELEEKIKNIPNEEEINNKYKAMYEKKVLKNKSNKLNKVSPDIEINKYTNILQRFPIITYKNIDENEIKNMVASECSFIVKYQYEISNKTHKKEEISINEIVDYIIIQENLSKQDKNRLLNKYERCEYLHKIYKDKLNIFKFDLNHIGVMTKEEWKAWLQEFHNLIKQEYPNDIQGDVIIDRCEYIYLKGKNKNQKCNKIECRIKSHKKID